MSFAKWHRRAEAPGVLFTEQETCGVLGIEVLAGSGEAKLDGRALTFLVIEGAGEARGESLAVEDLLYVPAGAEGTLEYALEGRALVVRYAPAGEAVEPVRGHLLVRKGQALGYVRTQYRGAAHGWGPRVSGFNPEGIVYTDKLWGASRDVLAQELVMPPGHAVPCHQHGRLGAAPSGDDFWQLYYVWEGAARVDVGRSAGDIESLEIGPGSVLVYPNGVAHNVVAGGKGCRYVFLERRGVGEADGNLDLDAERDYEHRLTLRLETSLEEFLRAERAREKS